jgi:hypothetical protein
MKAFRNVMVIALFIGGCLVGAGRAALADTGYLSLVGDNPYNGSCPATFKFTGHIDGTPGSSVTYYFAHFSGGHATDSAPVTATIPAGGSLAILSLLTLDSTQQGFQSYGLQISAPPGSDADTHGKVYFTLNCVLPPMNVPQLSADTTVIALHAILAYFHDKTGPNSQCSPGQLAPPGYPIEDFGNAVAVGYIHFQRGANGDPCLAHLDSIYRIMLWGNVPALRGVSSVVLTATSVGVDTNATGTCKLGTLSGVNGRFNTGYVWEASRFSQSDSSRWTTSDPAQTHVNYQIYPISGMPLGLDATFNAMMARQYATGFQIELMLKGPNENLDTDSLRCVLKYTNFNLNIIAG